MVACTRADRRVLACLAALTLAAVPAGAATVHNRGEVITYSFDEAEADLNADIQVLRGNVRVAQGTTSLTSEQAIIREPQAERSRWTFERDVHLVTPEVDLRSDTASATFVNGAIAQARVTGSPAHFEQLGEEERQVRGRAGSIEYDMSQGVVTLTGEVWFSFGENEFRGDTVVYHLRDERVRVNPGGARNRVNITIHPENAKGSSGSRNGSQDGQAPAREGPDDPESGA